MAYVSEDDLYDGISLLAGARRTKSWTIKNTGTCAWGPGYELVKVSDDALAIVARRPVDSCAPGENLTITVGLQVPEEVGDHRSDWRLCVNGDECFGPTLYVLVHSLGKATPVPTPVTGADLTASVRFTGTQFVITNLDDFDWTDVRMEINGGGLFRSGYKLQADLLESGHVYTVGAGQFTLSDGTRLNPFTTKPLNMSISCDQGFYYGTWD